MFDKLLSELKKMKRMQISIPIETDSDGYFDKECPSDDCNFHFKVFADDWVEKFKDESVYCPFCGHNAPADSFSTREQDKQAEEQAYKYFESRLNKALADSAKDFNKKQPKSGFITMRMKYEGSSSVYYFLPLQARKELQQKITCSKCSSRYAVLGSAFFCPCCGHNSILETFDNSIKKIEANLKNLETIYTAVSKINEDEAEITKRSLIESGLSDSVVAFQRFLEKTYEMNKKGDIRIKANAFQNLEIGSSYWKKLFNESYQDWLLPEQYNRLHILFQRRHLLAHREGIVDDKYIMKTGDNNYKLGQRIVVKESDVYEVIKLIKRIINKVAELSN